jgi:hypothetical protein
VETGKYTIRPFAMKKYHALILPANATESILWEQDFAAKIERCMQPNVRDAGDQSIFGIRDQDSAEELRTLFERHCKTPNCVC